MATNSSANIPTAASGKVLQGGGVGSASVFSTATYPSTAGTSGKILISDGTNIISSTPTYPNASATAGKIIISDGTNYVASTPTYPNTSGTAGKVVVSDGTNNVYSTPTFPNASATSRKIIVSDGTNWVASTETYAVPGTSGNVMKSDGTNWTSAAISVVGSFVLIQSQTASNSTTLDFTTGVSSYTNWLMSYRGMTPASDGASLRMQISTNGGSSWVATTYTSGHNSAAYNTSTLTNLNSSTNFYVSALQDSGAATSCSSGNIWINNVSSQGSYIFGTGGGSDSGGTTNMVIFTGKVTTSGANAFRMIMSSGNINTGVFTLYGQVVA